MFDVVIPTIWSPNIEFIDDNIKSLSESKKVSKIILINNRPDKYRERYRNNLKVIELCFNNIYVNQAWNVGVQLSTSDNVCLMNDDIQFNLNVLDFVQKSLSELDDAKIIGVCKSAYSLDSDTDYSLEKITVRNRGWGCLIFVKRNYYTPIPTDLKIHFGDDYLIKQLEDYVWKLKGLKISSQISTSINSDEKFSQIIQQDNINSLKYGLPWSNDF